MKKTRITTSHKKLLADIYTPVSIYLRLRDRFRDTILLESTDFHANENNYSYIAVNAIAGIEIKDLNQLEYKLPMKEVVIIPIQGTTNVSEELWHFMQRFEIERVEVKPINIAQGVFGYTTYDAIPFFETLDLTKNVVANSKDEFAIPLMRYRLYQYVIAINHFKDEMYICENHVAGLSSDSSLLESLIKSKDVPNYPFKISGEETSNLTNDQYLEIVNEGIRHCLRGDVFQIVLSRCFKQKFTGDDFQAYRALRSINPSPYLFYFDYGDYKLMGSSPESQIIIENGQAIVHPIAGTFKRTGDDARDKKLAGELLVDEKENAEHVMLVDLARNDLSRNCSNVKVTQFCKIQYYSHVIHMVSEVTGDVEAGTNPFKLLAASFPAGTLSGAPKYKAMELINKYENTSRSYYGGCIGFIGFDGSCNHAIMIRTFLSKNNTLVYQAGAGIVAVSNPENELNEVNNKLNALKTAIGMANTI